MANQIKGMAVHWPELIPSSHGVMTLWQGLVQPLMQKYQIQILYSLVALPFAGIDRGCPHVEVVNPLLHGRNGDPVDTVPHTFPNKVMPERPRLCLHLQDEWSSEDAIATTIVFWTLDWLVCYEGWLATGHWAGGGHGTERQEHR